MGSKSRDIFEQAGIIQGQKVLDVGFRDLQELQDMATLVGSTGHVVGIDINSQNVKTAQEEMETLDYSNISIAKGSVLSIPAENAVFDLILCKGILHEVRELNKALKEMARTIKERGILTIIDFQRFSRVKFRLYKFKARRSGFQGDDIHPGFTRPQLLNLLTKQEFEEISFQLLPQKWTLGSYKLNVFLLRARRERRTLKK
ncbi:MAG: class I SAM-dependent methyltransferase [Candidatus Hodarchaeales archaeon]